MRYPLSVLALLLHGCGAPRPSAEAPPPPSSAEPPPMQLDPTPGEPLSSSPACSGDATCGWARCDLRAGRCFFPCVRDEHCADGARCLPAPGNPEILVCAAPLDGP